MNFIDTRWPYSVGFFIGVWVVKPVLAFPTRKGLAGNNIYIRRTPKHQLFLSKLRTLGSNNTHYNDDLFCLALLCPLKEQFTEFMAQY